MPKLGSGAELQSKNKTCLSIEREALYKCETPIAAKSPKSGSEYQKSLLVFDFTKEMLICLHHNVLRALWAAQGRPRAAQERPKSGPRTTQERPKTGQERPGAAQDPRKKTKTAQECPNTAPRPPKTAPKLPQYMHVCERMYVCASMCGCACSSCKR